MLQPAMRYSFLVTMRATVSADNTGFWIRGTARTAGFRTPNINVYYPDAFDPNLKAILNYRLPVSVGAGATNIELSITFPVQPPSGIQGRPAAHGINWKGWTEALQSILANNKNLNESRVRASTEAASYRSITNSGPLDVQARATRILQTQSPSANTQLLNDQIPFPTTEPVPAASAVALDPNLCRPYPGDELAPASYDEMVVIDVSTALDLDGVTRWKMNGVTYQIGTKPVIFEILQGEPIPVYVNPIWITLGNVSRLVSHLLLRIA